MLNEKYLIQFSFKTLCLTDSTPTPPPNLLLHLFTTPRSIVNLMENKRDIWVLQRSKSEKTNEKFHERSLTYLPKAAILIHCYLNIIAINMERKTIHASNTAEEEIIRENECCRLRNECMSRIKTNLFVNPTRCFWSVENFSMSKLFHFMIKLFHPEIFIWN